MSPPQDPADEPSPPRRGVDDRLLFCPFCRECYEGERECPVHELTLVEFQDLPRRADERELPGWDEPVDPWDVRFGRGWIALGASLLLVGFFLPVASGAVEDVSRSWTGYQLAISRAGNLWTVPFIAVMFSWFLLRRRTPVQMLGTRLVASVLSLTPLVSLGYSVYRVESALAQLHGAMSLEWGAGLYVMAAGSVLLLVGSLRFGVMPLDGLPHGAEPPDDDSRGIAPRD